MKHKNLLKIMVVVMVLAMCMTMLFACKPEEKPVEEAKFTAKNTADEIGNAIVNSLGAVGPKDEKVKVGFQYALEIPTDSGSSTINIAGYLDTETAANTKVYLDFVENEFRTFSLSATENYIYFDSMDAKRKFPNFKLGELLAGVDLPNSNDISGGMIGSLPGVIFDLIMDISKDDSPCEHEADEDGIIMDTIYGSLSGLAPMLGGIVDGIIPGVGAKLADLLNQVELELTATINPTAEPKFDENKVLKNGIIEYVDLGIKTDSSDTTVTFVSKLEQGFNPFTESPDDFKIPNAKDNRYVETNILNFVLGGDFTFELPGNEKAVYNYDVKLDLNPFELLENAVVVQKMYEKDEDGNVVKRNEKGEIDENGTDSIIEKLAFDVTKLLDIKDGGLYVNISHKCTDACKDLHVVPANGNVFSLAFSPRDFGNGNIYMSFDLQSIMPKGLVSDDVLKLIPAGTQTLTMDTKALLASASAPVDTNPDRIAAVDMLENYNPLKTIGAAFEFLSEITYSNANGVRVELNSLINAVNTASPLINKAIAENKDITLQLVVAAMKKIDGNVDANGDLAIDKILKKALLGADAAVVAVRDAAYGVEALNKFNFKTAFDQKNETEAKPIDRVVSVAPVLNAQGEIQITLDEKEEAVQMYRDGKLFMTDKEWNAVLGSKKTVKVTYKTASGKVSEPVDANVVIISGLDTAKAGVEQEVYVVLAPVDGITPGNGHIAAHQFTTKVTVVEAESAKFTQAEASKLDTSKEYAFGAAVNVNYDLVITFPKAKGEEKAYTKTYAAVAPTSNAQLVKDGKVNALANIKLGYNKFGYTQDVEIKVSTKQEANVVEKKINAGEKLVIAPSFNFKYKEGEAVKEATLSGIDMINAKTAEVKFTKDADRKVFKTEYKKNLFGKDVFNGYSVIFDEAGSYELTVKVVGGYSVTYKIEVVLPGVPVKA